MNNSEISPLDTLRTLRASRNRAFKDVIGFMGFGVLILNEGVQIDSPPMIAGGMLGVTLSVVSGMRWESFDRSQSNLTNAIVASIIEA